jgi:predicted metalloprotease with PDZ domain
MQHWLYPFLCAAFCSATLIAQEETEAYQYYVNLGSVNNDMLEVQLIAPQSVTGTDLIYHFPATVPGTYEILDFGRYVQDLKAFDKRNKELKVERTDQNTWKIKAERKVHKITYKIEDTWDATLKNPVFEPAGTSFEAGKAFVINHSGCFGFFKNKENLPFVLKFDRPSTFYGATSLERVDGDFDTDIYQVEAYRDLIDAPIMYTVADTMIFKLGYSDIEIVVYSPNKKVTAKELGKRIRPVVEAQNKYLGDILPVNRYVFILYLSADGYTSGNIGALEHSRSSMFCLVEEAAEKIAKQVSDIAAHEFFHIVTPLFIHSEEIQNFDFMNPKMSQHLWLYEGVVEYMSQHVQVKSNLVSDDKFLEMLGDKVRASYKFKDGFSLTEMSANCLVEPYSKGYNNIYYKGAMTAACMEARLLYMSNGQYGLQDMIKDLSGFYGKDNPFKDGELFDKIYELASKSGFITDVKPLKEFVEKHIKGAERLPYDDFMRPFGITYAEQAKINEISPMGGIENGVLKNDSLSRFYIAKAEKMDDFGKISIGLKQNDIITDWNGKPFTVKAVSGLLLTYLDNAKENDPLEIKVLRKNEAGVLEPMTLTTKLTKVPVDKKHVFIFVDKPTPEQLKLRKIWLDEKQ